MNLIGQCDLASFSTMNLVLHLEEVDGINFSGLDLDVALLDSLDVIEALVGSRLAQG